MIEVSADWVLPVDGPPIEGGLIHYENGAVVEVTTGRAAHHYDDAAIVPGFVNAHSHLEYAMYAGFGDGSAFGPWIATHVERKNRLERDDMLSIARLGVLESLRAGIATTADYSFSGVAATAADELGLRAIVYLEVFASDPAEAERQFNGKREQVTETALVRIGISPHAPYTCSLATYEWCLSLGIPVGTHLAESANENEWLEHGSGPLYGIPILVEPTGKRAVGTLEPVLGPDLLCAHCVEVNEAEVALLAERNVPVAHCPRSNALLGCGIAPVAELRARDGLARLDAVHRHVRGDAHGDLHGARPHAASGGPPRRGRAADGDARCGPGAADRRSGGYPDARQACRPGGRVARGKPVPSGRGSRSGRRLRWLTGTSARDDRRRPHPLRKRGQRTVAKGTQHRKRRPAANARSAAVAAPKRQKPPEWQEQLFFQRLRNHAKWAYVFLAISFVLGFVLLGVGSGSTGISDVLGNMFSSSSSSGTSISKLQKKVDQAPQNAKAWRDLATALEQKQRTQDAVNALERYTALRPKDQNALAELASQYGTLAQNYATDYQNAQAEASQYASPGAVFAPPSSTPFGKAFADPTALQDPISTVIQTQASTKQNTAYTNFQSAQKSAEGVYQKLAALNPSDATTQIQLGQAAQAAGDTKAAIAAFNAFLKLAPTDPLAPQVKQALKSLKLQSAIPSSVTGG